MTTHQPKVNNDTAPIKNVAACLSLIRSLQSRHPHQNNLGFFVGYSGYGKSVAALYCQNKTGAAYVEISDVWRRGDLMRAILFELGVYQPRGTLAQLHDEVIGALARDPKRPLIIDEADFLVKNRMIELVRSIAKKSNVPILLIGEENFPKKIETDDRFRDLFLVHGFAQACDLQDARTLARTFYPDLAIDDALLDRAREEGEGRVRRICNSLHSIATAASRLGVSELSEQQYDAADGKFSRSKFPTRKEAA